MDKIQEFSDTELIEELSKRFDHFIMAGRKDKYKGEEMAARRRFWSGDMDVCIGLISGTAIDCLHKNWGIRGDDIGY